MWFFPCIFLTKLNYLYTFIVYRLGVLPFHTYKVCFLERKLRISWFCLIKFSFMVVVYCLGSLLVIAVMLNWLMWAKKNTVSTVPSAFIWQLKYKLGWSLLWRPTKINTTLYLVNRRFLTSLSCLQHRPVCSKQVHYSSHECSHCTFPNVSGVV